MDDSGTSTSATDSSKARTLTVSLFAIYGVLLIGLVLAKFPFRYDLSPTGRELNLIPFTGLFSNFGAFHLSEVVQNIAIFIPFGIFISMLTRGWSFGKKLLPIIATTVGFEVIQFISGTGRADITDVADNVLGGVIGLVIYLAAARVWGTKAHRTLNVAGIVFTVAALTMVTIVFTNTLRAG
jgi:glycopeptide antibiotics resistance protein